MDASMVIHYLVEISLLLFQLWSNENIHCHWTFVFTWHLYFKNRNQMDVFKQDDLWGVVPILPSIHHWCVITSPLSSPPTFWLNDDSLQLNFFDLIPNLLSLVFLKITFVTNLTMKLTSSSREWSDDQSSRSVIIALHYITLQIWRQTWYLSKKLPDRSFGCLNFAQNAWCGIMANSRQNSINASKCQKLKKDIPQCV